MTILKIYRIEEMYGKLRYNYNMRHPEMPYNGIVEAGKVKQ
jgi:hypothetical protein